MAYADQDDKIFIEDLIQRKEFYWTKRWEYDKTNITDDIIPRFKLSDQINRSNYLRLLGHQLFTQNYMNPNTEYKRLHIKWSTGAGKTLGGLSIAMNFIKNYRLEKESGSLDIGSVFIIGFAERAFKNELLRYPEFGFMSNDEKIKLDKLKKLAAAGNKIDLEKYQELIIRIKKRFSNRKGNGFFRFFGYKAFVNRIFTASADTNINDLSEEQIRTALSDGRIKYNEELLKEFKNSLIICDEIHNVYNSAEKNNWGVAIQAVLDKEPSVRCVTLSATPLNNSPSEIVDLLNLLNIAEKRIVRSDLFVNDKQLKPGALEKIAELSKGKFSFLIDINPKYYPKILNYGDTLKEIPYLKFIRCPMSDFHYKTYKDVYTGALSHDSQYLVDFALPNPEDEKTGIFQTQQIKKLLTTAPQKWKDKNKIDYIDDKIVGDILLKENIGKYSNKYYKLLEEIESVIKNKQGKIFIYHNVVHMSGVLFIEQLLIKNGYLDEFSSSSDNTICVKCGRTRKQHNKDEISGGSSVVEILGGFEDNGISETGSAQREEDDTIINEIGETNIPENTDNTDNAPDNTDNIPDNTDNIPDNTSDNKPDNTPDNAPDNAPELIKTQTGHDWYLNGQHILNIKIFDNKAVLSGAHNILLDYNDNIINQFNKILNNLYNKNVEIILKNNISNKLGKWLLDNKFKLIKYTPDKSILQRKKSKHKIGGAQPIKIIKEKDGKHKFIPARFVMAHSDIEKPRMEQSIEKYNNIDNITGDNYLILVGSRIIKESYDIKAIQNLFVMSRPDNIPMFIQIRGRAVRKDSHKGLPEENRVVRIKIFTSCLPVKQDMGPDKGTYQLSYEEEKYRDKVAAFQIIQKIEKVIHENAIDSVINYDKVKKSMIDDPLGPLEYTPEINKKYNKMQLSELNLSTFDIYHAKKEVNIIKFLIKRLFIELSSVWEYNDLLNAVKNPPKEYDLEINTSLIQENNFMIAMNQLIYDEGLYNEPIINMSDNIIEKLYDSNDKIITMPNGQNNIIVPICDKSNKQYYILFPLDTINKKPNIDLELPYRIIKQEENKVININSFIQTKRIDFDYDDKKKIFYRKYTDINIENMENVVCEYGTTFHMKFIEECIVYVFNIWTSPTIEKSPMHEFYFKMLYYYDLLSLIIWAHTCKNRIFKEYIKYAIPVNSKDIKLKALSKYEKRKEELEDISPHDNSDLASSGVINLLKSTYNKTSNAWIPEEFREQYEKTINKSIDLFDGKKKKIKSISKVNADLLPIGHYISKFPKLYIPDKGWDENPTYLQNEQLYKENNYLIGFDERSATGVHIRFKLRNPIHNIKKYKDTRQTEKGTVCKSKSKEFLIDAAKKIDIILPEKINVEELCVLIRSKLIRLELKERIKKSNIKYFYFHYEQRPETL